MLQHPLCSAQHKAPWAGLPPTALLGMSGALSFATSGLLLHLLYLLFYLPPPSFPPSLPQPPQTQLMQLYQTWSNLWFGIPDLTWACLWERDALQRDLETTVLSVHSPSYTLYPPHSEQLCNFSFDVFFPLCGFSWQLGSQQVCSIDYFNECAFGLEQGR